MSEAVIPAFDIDQTLISQYANSPTLTQLVQDFGQWFDPTANLTAFYDTVWNLDTAAGFGQDIWGRILGVSRLVPIPGTAGAFGFGLYLMVRESRARTAAHTGAVQHA